MEMEACLELNWLTAGRIGDILQLTPKSIAVLDEVTMVKFTHGKTVAYRTSFSQKDRQVRPKSLNPPNPTKQKYEGEEVIITKRAHLKSSKLKDK